MATQRSTTAPATWPTFDDLRVLAREPRDGIRVSIVFDLPDRPGFPDLRAIRKRYEIAVESAARRLEGLGVERGTAQGLVGALEALELHAGSSIELDGGSLPPVRGSIAVLVGPEERPRVFALEGDWPDRVHVGRAYRLRPLLAEVHRDRPFRVLALSLHEVRVFEGDSHGLRELDDPRVPRSLADAIRGEVGATPEGSFEGRPSHELPPFQGHSGADLDRFHFLVARALSRVWPDRRDPLVLVADGTHRGRFDGDARLAGLLANGVARNPRDLDAAALHALAWPVAREAHDALDREDAARVNEGSTRSGAVLELRPAITAVLASRVSRLWIDEGLEVPGRVDLATGAVDPPLGDDELLDDLATLVIAYGGTVATHRGEIRTASGLAAELR